MICPEAALLIEKLQDIRGQLFGPITDEQRALIDRNRLEKEYIATLEAIRKHHKHCKVCRRIE